MTQFTTCIKITFPTGTIFVYGSGQSCVFTDGPNKSLVLELAERVIRLGADDSVVTLVTGLLPYLKVQVFPHPARSLAHCLDQLIEIDFPQRRVTTIDGSRSSIQCSFAEFTNAGPLTFPSGMVYL